MSESKGYISRPEEKGEVNISEEVLATIAAAAALDVEGVGSLSAGVGDDMSNAQARKGIAKAVRLAVEDGKVRVDVSLLVNYGSPVTTVARSVQEAVSSAVENTSGLEVAGVNVTVTGVTFQK